MRNGVILITYADSFGGNLASLRANLEKHFSGCISGIHLLPFFPSTGDRGFSPLRYDLIDPAFGNWKDLTALGETYEIIADFMVNHISKGSLYFRDWIEKEERSEYADLFLPLEKVFGSEAPTGEEISAIYRRQPTEPWLTVKFPSGNEKKIWCTFSEEQIDIDILSSSGLRLFKETVSRLAAAGITTLRLDAVGYITKQRGTSCFMVEPAIWDILTRLKNTAAEYGVELLPEMHEHYSIQLRMAEKGYYVYDFALPMLLLYAWYAKDFSPLKHWLSICPRRQFTTLDTHDGIGVVDAADLLTQQQTDFTTDRLYAMGSNVKRKYSSTEYNNLDIYQINCTYYSALGEDDDAYLTARAIQFFAPGIPQVYYVGMLAGKNDLELVERTRNGRDINRHDYSTEEIEAELNRPAAARLRNLMRFRMNCPAFNGSFTISRQEKASRLHLVWSSESSSAELVVDLETKTCIISTVTDGKRESFSP